MHEEHAGQFHEAQAHHTRRIHLRRARVLDTTGNFKSNLRAHINLIHSLPNFNLTCQN